MVKCPPDRRCCGTCVLWTKLGPWLGHWQKTQGRCEQFGFELVADGVCDQHTQKVRRKKAA